MAETGRLEGAFIRGRPAVWLSSFLARDTSVGRVLTEALEAMPDKGEGERALKSDLVRFFRLLDQEAEAWRAARVAGMSAGGPSDLAPADLLVSSEHERIIDSDRAAELLNVTPRQVRRLCRSGHLDADQERRPWLITRDSVLAYREGRRRRPTSMRTG